MRSVWKQGREPITTFRLAACAPLFPMELHSGTQTAFRPYEFT